MELGLRVRSSLVNRVRACQSAPMLSVLQAYGRLTGNHAGRIVAPGIEWYTAASFDQKRRSIMACVLITGTSTGIGLATALSLGRAGHQVYATMRNPSRAPELAEKTAREKLPIKISTMDVDSDSSVKTGI